MSLSASPISVVHVIGSFDPRNGGTSETVGRLSSAMAHHGNPITVVALANPAEHPRLAEHWKLLHEQGVALRFMPDSPWRPSRTRAWLQRELKHPTAVHIHGVWEPVLWAAAQEAVLRDCPYVVCPHGMLDRWSRRRSAWKKKIAWRLGAGRLMGQAAAIQCLTEHDARETAEVVGADRIAIVPTGVDVDRYSALACHRSGVRERDELNILYLGRIHPKKGLDLLIQGLASVPKKCHLYIAGPEEDKEFVERCRRIASASSGANRIHWVGPVAGASKDELLRTSDLFVLPSHQEGFSLAILEAMAAGLPVIITDQCHFPAVEERGAGIVARPTAEAIGEALVRFTCLTPNRWLEMGKRGRELVCARFSWQGISSRLLDLYRKLVDDSVRHSLRP